MSYVKYPRTFHLPWSLGATSDDRRMSNVQAFEGREIIVTEKMDGENTTLYCDHAHARSIDSADHPSRSWVKGFWATIRGDIPEGMRICGENLYAKHSICYQDLSSYFLGFSVWDQNVCLSWEKTLEWFELLGVCPVPELYQGPFDETLLRDLADNLAIQQQEGYVIRVVEEFSEQDFPAVVGKVVRAGHVTTEEHWMHSQLEVNALR